MSRRVPPWTWLWISTTHRPSSFAQPAAMTIVPCHLRRQSSLGVSAIVNSRTTSSVSPDARLPKLIQWRASGEGTPRASSPGISCCRPVSKSRIVGVYVGREFEYRTAKNRLGPIQ